MNPNKGNRYIAPLSGTWRMSGWRGKFVPFGYCVVGFPTVPVFLIVLVIALSIMA